MASTVKSPLRTLVRRLLEDKSLGPAMINVNPVVDPSAAVTDPSNPNFKPSSKTELIVALKSLVDQLPDENIPDIYDSIKGSMVPKEDEDDKGKKQMNRDTKSEQLVRLAVRKILREVSKKAEREAEEYWKTVDSDAARAAFLDPKKGGTVKRIPSPAELYAAAGDPEAEAAMTAQDPSVAKFFEKMKKNASNIKQLQKDYRGKMEYLDDPPSEDTREYNQGEATYKQIKDALEQMGSPWTLTRARENGVLTFIRKLLKTMPERMDAVDELWSIRTQVLNDYINELEAGTAKRIIKLDERTGAPIYATGKNKLLPHLSEEEADLWRQSSENEEIADIIDNDTQFRLRQAAAIYEKFPQFNIGD